MVKLEEKYNLNHIYPLTTAQENIPIGARVSTTNTELELFEKSLALTSDLKKLPVLRSLSGGLRLGSEIHPNMAGSAFAHLTIIISLYNAEFADIDAENMIEQWFGQVWFDPLIGADMTLPEMSWDYEGAVLLHDTVTVVLEVFNRANAVGQAFAPGQVTSQLFLEIDWVAISTAQFKDYILEHIYAKHD